MARFYLNVSQKSLAKTKKDSGEPFIVIVTERLMAILIELNPLVGNCENLSCLQFKWLFSPNLEQINAHSHAPSTGGKQSGVLYACMRAN